jgi:hypothetical protein
LEGLRQGTYLIPLEPQAILATHAVAVSCNQLIGDQFEVIGGVGGEQLAGRPAKGVGELVKIGAGRRRVDLEQYSAESAVPVPDRCAIRGIPSVHKLGVLRSIGREAIEN